MESLTHSCREEEEVGMFHANPVNKSRVSTAKSTVSNDFVKNAMNLDRMPEMRQYKFESWI